MQSAGLDSVIEINPSVRTRLLSSQKKKPDFTYLYFTSCVSIVFVCLAAFWLWEHGFAASLTAHIFVGCTIFLLGLNALLGYKAKQKMREMRDSEYSDYVHRLSQVRTHEKLSRPSAGPIWIERNAHVI